MERKRIDIERKLKKAMREKFIELADAQLKSFDKEYDKYWAEEFERKLSDDEIKQFVLLFESMDGSQDSFDKVMHIIKETKLKSEQRIEERRQKAAAKEEVKKAKKAWNKDDYALLVKALNKYPGGTQNRWKTIAIYMGDQYTAKDVIEMTKELSEKGKQVVKGDKEQITRSKGGKEEDAKEAAATASEEPAWSEDDQKLLEDALRKYPKTMPAKERWTKIAEDIPGKSAKECLARFKYIASLIKKKSEK